MATRAPSSSVPETQLSTAQYPDTHYGIYSLYAGLGAGIVSIILVFSALNEQIALTVFASIAVVLLCLGSFTFAVTQLHKHDSKSANMGITLSLLSGAVFVITVLTMTLKLKGFIK